MVYELGAKHPVGVKRLGGKCLGVKRLGEEMVWGRNDPQPFCGCAGRFVSTLAVNPEDRFSCDVAHIE